MKIKPYQDELYISAKEGGEWVGGEGGGGMFLQINHLAI